MPPSARSPLTGGGTSRGSRSSLGVAPVARRRQLALTALTLAIVGFSVGAFVWTQIRKQEEAPITGIEIARSLAPGCDCPRESARLSFVLRRAQPVSATVVDEDGEPVRTLLKGALRESGRETLRWDGTGDGGRVVPDGDYRLRLDLAEPDRVIVIPDEVTLEAASDARSPRPAGRG